ncbi:MAG: hypothetical protein AAF585_19355 [Verrucomicrobiota bacterium]
MKTSLVCLAFALGVSAVFAQQYQFDDITIPTAKHDEPILPEFSLKAATDYLEKGSLAWTRDRGCISCHTQGSYMQAAPALTPFIGKPNEEIRGAFLEQLAKLRSEERQKFNSGTRTAQVIYIAAGLAEWDAHVGGKRAAETDEALQLMFDLQDEQGTWQSLDCWPPLESSAYQEATVAAIAAATAPGYLDAPNAAKENWVRLIDYLKTTPPPHDYGRVLLLWTATRVDDLVDDDAKQQIIDTILEKQHDDGGWALRDFAKPEEWGGGNRAQKLRAEPEFENPPSDGHMTGLATLVLIEAGVAADDERIQKSIAWMKSNQRESGRWWTRSLNTDKKHYITYSGTAYPLLALAKCGELPAAAGAE